MSKFATGYDYSRQPVYDSDGQFPCCDDRGIFSKAHTGVIQEMGELPGFILSKEDFDMLSPCRANDDVPIKKLIKAPVGDAPRGFVKPPNNPIFAHLGYFVSARVLTQVCLAAYLLSPQTLFNDNCSILHECRIGHSKRARTRIVFHHCGRFCCCDTSFPASILVSRCAYFRLHRRRVLLKIGAAFSVTDPCYVERKQVLGHAGAKLMWFQVPRLNSLKMPVPSADRALYFQSMGLQPHEYRTSTDIMRLAFQSFIRKFPNGTLNNELDPSTTLCTIKHFLGRDGDYRALPLMRPPSEKHERQGVVDTIDDDCMPEVDLDNSKKILPTPLLWDRHSFSCLKPGSSVMERELLNEKLDSKHLKPNAARPAVWANRIMTGHDTMLRSMFQDPAVRCDCPMASNNREYLDILTKESLAERATSSDVLGHFSDIEQIEHSYSAWTPPTSTKVKNKRSKKKLNSDPEWSLPSASSTMTKTGRGKRKERKKNTRRGFNISPIKLFKLHSPVTSRRSPAETQSATDSEVSDTLNASLLSLTIPDEDDFTQTSSRSKKPRAKAENPSSNVMHGKTRATKKNDAVPSLSVQLNNLSSHALGAVPRTVKLKYPSKNTSTGSTRTRRVKKKDTCSYTIDPDCFDTYVPLPSLPFEELEDEIDVVTPASFQPPTLNIDNNTGFKYPRTRSRDKQESRSVTPESIRFSPRHRKK